MITYCRKIWLDLEDGTYLNVTFYDFFRRCKDVYRICR